MPFDLKKFRKTKFSPRTEVVKVPALAPFFDTGEPLEFTVRSLTGEEMARANQAAKKAQNMAAAFEALASGGYQDKVEGLRGVLEISQGEVPEDLARRIEMLAIGCQAPQINIQDAAKLFQVAPVECWSLTNRIQILSGLGMVPGEPRGSGCEPTSEPPATSDTPETSASMS